ncbi:MAG: DUF1203 domain-containing protein [Alphaproteobacteria bacterium]|nr:MAG: DUF1203 domain-containing protein [Alphaproteobacteria bacterium]
MEFVITGLNPEPFRHLYGLSDADLAGHGGKRYIADQKPGFPDRIEMRDVEIGESLLLVNHVSMAEATPYRASHAIFIREGAEVAYRGDNEVPDVMYNRLLSLRAFDDRGWMLGAEVATGEEIRDVIGRLLSDPLAAYLHAHNAIRGCYSGRIDRKV